MCTKRRLSLGIHPVWSEYERLGPSYPKKVHSEDWSYQFDTQAGLSIYLAHRSFSWFVLLCASLAHYLEWYTGHGTIKELMMAL